MAKVLLTGGNGFIASHILGELLGRGYDVVTTVRSKTSGEQILESHPTLAQQRLRFEVVADITDEEEVSQALLSCPNFDYVIHTASPFTHVFTDPVRDMLDPSIKGTTVLLKVIHEHIPSVKRVILTSSVVAMLNPRAKDTAYEAIDIQWNPVTWEEAVQNPRLTYAASKKLAEKAAWDFMENEKPSFDLVSINPPLVFGPMVQHLTGIEHVNTSNQRIRDMAQGVFANTRLPPTGIFLWADVRDVSLAHIRALEVPEASGKRFLVAQGLFSNKDIAEAITECHPELASGLPSELVDDRPDNLFGFDNKRVTEILGVEFRTLKETVADTMESLLRLIR